jgi:hypothetical protein
LKLLGFTAEQNVNAVIVNHSRSTDEAGYATIGHTRPVPKPVQPSGDVQNLDPIMQHCRIGTKLATLVVSLQNPQGWLEADSTTAAIIRSNNTDPAIAPGFLLSVWWWLHGTKSRTGGYMVAT